MSLSISCDLISKLINDGLVKVNNKVIKDSYKIKNNDVILIEEDKNN